jgi:hypothetical protein
MDVYTIVRVGWEYNDEYYYTHDNEEGNPVIVYRSREGAEADCLAKNIECYKGLAESKYSTIGAYFQEWDYSDIEECKPALEKLNVSFSAHDINLPKTAPDDDWTQIIRLLGIVFYKIEVLEYVE